MWGGKASRFCDVPRSMAEIMSEMGLTHRTFFRRNHLEPLLAAGAPHDPSGSAQPSGPSLCADRSRGRPQGRRVKGDAGTGNGTDEWARSKPNDRIGRLFRHPSGQDELFEKSYEENWKRDVASRSSAWG